MSTLDEFLGPLDHGVWEVTVQKEQVTDPLGPGWERSQINVPAPGTIASYRMGRYHVHETNNEWKVHLDNHDPKTHPLMHLIDDAPLLLMIGDTFVTLIAGTRKTSGETREVLEGQKKAWQRQVILGIAVMFFGILVIDSPLDFFSGIFTLALPLVIIVMGIVTVYHELRTRENGRIDWEGFLRGLAIILAGIVAGFLPDQFWALITLAILAVWMFASALVLLFRVTKGRAAIPEGFYSRLAIALASMVLAVLILVEPEGVLTLLMLVIGAVAFLLGLMLLVNGVRLRRMMAAAHL